MKFPLFVLNCKYTTCEDYTIANSHYYGSNARGYNPKTYKNETIAISDNIYEILKAIPSYIRAKLDNNVIAELEVDIDIFVDDDYGDITTILGYTKWGGFDYFPMDGVTDLLLDFGGFDSQSEAHKHIGAILEYWDKEFNISVDLKSIVYTSYTDRVYINNQNDKVFDSLYVGKIICMDNIEKMVNNCYHFSSFSYINQVYDTLEKLINDIPKLYNVLTYDDCETFEILALQVTNMDRTLDIKLIDYDYNTSTPNLIITDDIINYMKSEGVKDPIKLIKMIAMKWKLEGEFNINSVIFKNSKEE